MCEGGSAVPQIGTYGDGEFNGSIQSWIGEVWSQPDADRSLLLEKLKQLVEIELRRRS